MLGTGGSSYTQCQFSSGSRAGALELSERSRRRRRRAAAEEEDALVLARGRGQRPGRWRGGRVRRCHPRTHPSDAPAAAAAAASAGLRKR
jgi:hypothetical protein